MEGRRKTKENKYVSYPGTCSWHPHFTLSSQACGDREGAFRNIQIALLEQDLEAYTSLGVGGGAVGSVREGGGADCKLLSEDLHMATVGLLWVIVQHYLHKEDERREASGETVTQERRYFYKDICQGHEAHLKL